MVKADIVTVTITCLVLLFLRAIYLTIYRLWLSPLAKFPGPKLAALTLWYEFYYDIVKGGGGLYIWEVKKMHQRYGPIVRVNPYELHVNDSAFFDEIYAPVNRPRNKFEWHSRGTTSPASFAFTPDHVLHRLRREPVQSYFSRRNIVTLEPIIQDKVKRLCQRLDEFAATQQPINLSVAFVALTVDIISQCCYADSFNYLKSPDFTPAWRETVIRRMKSMKIISHFPILLTLLRWFPRSLVSLVFGDVSAAGEHKRRIRAQVVRLIEGEKASPDSEERTIFKELLSTKSLLSEEKGVERLIDEGAVLLGAGSETVAKTLGIIIVHLMKNPDKVKRAETEILRTMPEQTGHSWITLEKLPYLSAIIKEGLRLHHGLAARNPRVATNEDLQYKQWTIPAGIPVSSLPALIHLNSKNFPEPEAFLPERWLQSEGKDLKGERMDMLSFGKGSRSCLGINLAYAELYITLAALVLHFEFIPYETDVRNVYLERDFTIPTPRIGSLGVRAIVKKKGPEYATS